MNKHIIFQELAEQHLVLVTIFVSLHPLALTIIEDNCSGHSTQHLQDEVIHLRIKVSTSQNLDFQTWQQVASTFLTLWRASGLCFGLRAVYLSPRLMLL